MKKTLLEQLKDNRERLVVWLQENEGERERIFAGIADIDKCIAALSPVSPPVDLGGLPAHDPNLTFGQEAIEQPNTTLGYGLSPVPGAGQESRDQLCSVAGCEIHGQLPEGFIPWSCGENDDFVCPVPLGTVIQILRRDQIKRARKIDAEFSKETYWYTDGVEGDIIAYRVVAEPGVYLDWETPDGSDGEVFPEGVTKDTEVSVIQRDGGWFTSFGDGFCWDSDIIAYRIIADSPGDSGNPAAEDGRDVVRIEPQEIEALGEQSEPLSEKHLEPCE